MATKTSNIGNTYQYPKVLMSPIMDDQSGVLDNSLEPQYVRVRTRNASFSYIDNFDLTSRLSNTQMLITSPGTLLAKRTKRFSLSYYSSFLVTPNINVRNNTIVFQTVNGSFAVTIPEGFYSMSQAITALITALNTVQGPSGCIFTSTRQFANSDYYTTINGTIPFKIASGSFVTRGYAFWGFLKNDPRLSTLSPFYQSLSLGPISTFYSRYYDIISFNLLEHTKAANTGNRVPGSLILRIYMTFNQDGTSGELKAPIQEFAQTPENSSWNYDASHSLSSIDLQILDEFGDPYYLPNGITNASYIQMALVNEI